MPKLIGMGIAIFVLLITVMSSCTVIDTGNVGVKTTFGQMSNSEIPAGFNLKAPFVTSVMHLTVKETTLDLSDLNPKAKDNLNLKDLDVSIYYQVNPSKVADLLIEYKGQTEYDSEFGIYLPGSGIVTRASREAIYDAVSSMDSLTIHQRRVQLVTEISNKLQTKLDNIAPNTFTVNNVLIRSISTDPSIEQSIRKAVQAQKELEQKAVQTQIAEQDAKIKITEARGIAEANRIINSSLTREYLQHEKNVAMQTFAERKGGTNTVILPSDMSTSPLINVK